MRKGAGPAFLPRLQDLMSFGEKVRYFRQKRNMTQKELAGDFITRNMLSRIETGDASPSLATIEYLTERLGLPKGFLLCDTMDVASYERQEFLSDAKALLSEEQYEACIARIEESELSRDDELGFIRLAALFRLGVKHYREARYREARDLFARLCEAPENFYFSGAELRAAKLYIAVIDSYTEGKTALENIRAEDPHLDEYLYATAMRLLHTPGDNGTSNIDRALLIADLPLLQEPLYTDHIRAKSALLRGEYEAAITALQALYGKAKKHGNRFLLYGVCSDLETSYKLRSDFRGAYEMAAEKNAILRPIQG